MYKQYNSFRFFPITSPTSISIVFSTTWSGVNEKKKVKAVQHGTDPSYCTLVCWRLIETNIHRQKTDGIQHRSAVIPHKIVTTFEPSTISKLYLECRYTSCCEIYKHIVRNKLALCCNCIHRNIGLREANAGIKTRIKDRKEKSRWTRKDRDGWFIAV